MEINYTAKNQTELFKNTLPFIKGTNVFIQTKEPLKLGEEVSIHCQLIDEKKMVTLKGKVVWLVPQTIQNKALNDVGIQIFESDII